MEMKMGSWCQAEGGGEGGLKKKMQNSRATLRAIERKVIELRVESDLLKVAKVKTEAEAHSFQATKESLEKDFKNLQLIAEAMKKKNEEVKTQYQHLKFDEHDALIIEKYKYGPALCLTWWTCWVIGLQGHGGQAVSQHYKNIGFLQQQKTSLKKL